MFLNIWIVFHVTVSFIGAVDDAHSIGSEVYNVGYAHTIQKFIVFRGEKLVVGSSAYDGRLQRRYGALA